jgi:hypothetical protein
MSISFFFIMMSFQLAVRLSLKFADGEGPQRIPLHDKTHDVPQVSNRQRNFYTSPLTVELEMRSKKAMAEAYVERAIPRSSLKQYTSL